MNRFLKVLKIIKDVLGYLVMLVLVGMTVFVLVTNSRGDVPFFGNHSIMWVLTESMEPVIPERSNILVEKVDPSELAVGDIIVFVSRDPLIEGQRNTHRIAEIIGDNEEFVTKGDHNQVEDAYHVFPEDVVGRYVRNLPIVTRFTRLLSTKMGLMMIIVVVMAVMMLLYLPDLKKSLKKQEEEAAKSHEEFIEEMVRQELEKMKSMNLVIPGLNDAPAGTSAEVTSAEDAGDEPASDNTTGEDDKCSRA